MQFFRLDKDNIVVAVGPWDGKGLPPPTTIVRRFELEEAIVSTVFLSVGNYDATHFETMIFCEKLPLLDQYQERTKTYEEAVACHERCVQKLLYLGGKSAKRKK